MTANQATVAHQVMWNRLISIVEEQAQALIRTAFSTSVREAGDLSAGVYDAKGRMLAQAVTGTPGHVNSMAESVRHFIRRIGVDQIYPGDIYITNDPWEGTGHLHDITVVTPVFYDDALVGYFACTAHVVDIGGRGFGADAASVFEEGLRIPIMKLAERGTVDQAFIQLVRCNVREPDQVVGDIYALATCNDIGERRLTAMLAEYGATDLVAIAGYIFERSRAATCAAIAALPNAEADGTMVIDGYASPITLSVNVRIADDQVFCDYAGSSALDPKGINVPLVYTQAYSCYALKCAIAPEVPNNWASLAPFNVTAPADCILNAPDPAPVALRHAVGHMLPDTIFAALDQILPATVPAEGAGTLCNFNLSLRPVAGGGPRSEVLSFNSGGGGARPSLDGMNATAFPSGVMTMPVEATEHTGPVIIWRKELRPDSGGAGQYRGGLGQVMELEARAGYQFDLSAMFERVHYPARGRCGGKAGAPTVLERSDGTRLNGKGKQAVPAGQRVRMAFPGGGGYGDPPARDPAMVRQDLVRGYISAALARDTYGLSDATITQVLQRAVIDDSLD